MRKVLSCFLSLILSVTLFTGFQLNVIRADDLDTPIDEIPLDPYICEECNNFAYYYCTHETIYDSSGTHNSSGCVVTYYKSRLMIYCDYCGMHQYLMNGTGNGYAYHFCIERHTKCVPNRRVLCSWYD